MPLSNIPGRAIGEMPGVMMTIVASMVSFLARFRHSAPRSSQHLKAANMSFDLSSYFTAIEKGAANIYHQVLATGTEVKDWEATHPALMPFVSQAVGFSEGLITRVTGVPAGTIAVAAEDVIATLKGMAAADSTVPSVPMSATTTTTTSTLGSLEQAAIGAVIASAEGQAV